MEASSSEPEGEAITSIIFLFIPAGIGTRQAELWKYRPANLEGNDLVRSILVLFLILSLPNISPLETRPCGRVVKWLRNIMHQGYVTVSLPCSPVRVCRS